VLSSCCFIEIGFKIKPLFGFFTAVKSPQPGPPVHLAIFLSGKGSNAENIIRYFHEHPAIRVTALYTDKENSGASDLGEKHDLHVLLFSREALQDPEGLLSKDLKEKKVDFIILAGFLKLIPGWLIAQYPGRILNIHPALLPKYGGKGMYGRKVHEAVWESKASESGITIHLVDEHYDEGQIVAQFQCPVLSTDSPDEIENKVRQLEARHFPVEIERFILAGPLG
jgi:phosphoribosylglycinamide formyltransferase 1